MSKQTTKQSIKSTVARSVGATIPAARYYGVKAAKEVRSFWDEVKSSYQQHEKMRQRMQ